MVTSFPHYIGFLENSAPGSPKHEVFNKQFERKKDWEECIKAVIQDPESRTLFYAVPESALPSQPSDKVMTDQIFALHMDDSVQIVSGFGLQKDSEFLQLFNHKILKAMEGGVYKRLYRKHHMDLFTKENFEMMEAHPLTLNNVLFCFITLGFGIFLSILKVIMELITKKIQ